jgi:hypothetical protein
VIARTWSRRVTLLTSDATVLTALRYLECDPDITGRSQDEQAIFVEPYRSYYRILREGKVLGEQLSAQGVTESLHAELTILSLADFPTDAVIHAASLLRDGRRILFVGQKGSGKTTLSLRLIREGYEIEGDENVFVTRGGVVARPRGLRIKEQTVILLPYLAEALNTAGYYESRPGQRIYNLDPRTAGAQSWRIKRGPVHAVIIVRSNHGGLSSFRPINPLALVREVIDECALPRQGRAEAIGAVVRLVGKASGFHLALGDLDGAVDCIDRVCEEIADSVATTPQ